MIEEGWKEIQGRGENWVVGKWGRDEWYMVQDGMNKNQVDKEKGGGVEGEVCMEGMEFNGEGRIEGVKVWK